MKKSFIISIIITIIAVIVAIGFLMNVEGEIPIHWDMYGEVDGYGTPLTMFIFPGVSLFMVFLLYFIPKIDPKGENIKTSGLFLPVITVLLSILMLGLEIFIIMAVNGSSVFNVNMFMSIFLAVLFCVMGYYIPKIKPNYTVGIRTPWTLYSEDVWVKTHNISGKWFIAAGLSFLISVFFKEPYNIVIPFIFTMVVAIGVIIYSYILFAEEKKEKGV